MSSRTEIMRSEVKKVPARKTMAKTPWGSDFIFLTHCWSGIYPAGNLAGVNGVSMVDVTWPTEGHASTFIIWSSLASRSLSEYGGSLCQYIRGWKSPELLPVTVLYLCLCGWVMSLSVHISSFSFPCKWQGALGGCISMNVYSLHKEHGQCSGTWESRHRFQAAALRRILPSGFAPLCPWSSVEERHDPNRSLLEKSDWAVRYLWPGLNILW